jgi:hypothetical protein
MPTELIQKAQNIMFSSRDNINKFLEIREIINQAYKAGAMNQVPKSNGNAQYTTRSCELQSQYNQSTHETMGC